MKILMTVFITSLSINAMADAYEKFPGVKLSDSRLFVTSFTEFPDIELVRATVLINGVDAKKLYNDLGKVIGTKAEEVSEEHGVLNRRVYSNSLSCWKKVNKYNCSVFLGF